jgi:hypothetical protein
MTNAAEYTQGQDLRSGTMLQAFDQVKYTVTPTADACGTGQTLVKIEISNVPLVPTVAFADADPYLSVAGNLNLSHDRHENLLMISVVSTPTNPAVKSEISVAYQLMDFDRPEESGDLDNSHFVFLGPLN